MTPAACRPRLDRLLWLGALAGVIGLITWPIWAVDLPVVLDYPNHLARAYILLHGATDPFFSQVYQTTWAIIPNIGIDLILPPLLAVLPVPDAGRLVLTLSVVLPVLGTVVYARTLHGVWSWWSLGAGLVAYNLGTLLGAMNFLLGIGLALFGAAAWTQWSARRPWLALGLLVPFATLVFFAHLIAVALLALLIGSDLLVALWHGWRGGTLRPGDVLRRILQAGAVFVLPAGLFLLSPLENTPLAPVWPGETTFLTYPFSGFLNYDLPLDVATALAAAAVVLLAMLVRRIGLAPAAVLALVVLGVTYPMTPSNVKGTGFINIRAPIMAGYLLFAAFRPRLPRLPGGCVIAVFAAVFVGRILFLTSVWHGYDQDVRDVRQVIAAVPPASSVLVAMGTGITADGRPPPRARSLGVRYPSYMHIAALLVTERHAMWPLLFTIQSKQPLSVRPAWRDRSQGEGVPPDYHVLTKPVPSPVDIGDASYLRGWWQHFDYVLVINAGDAADLDTLAPARLEPVARAGFAVLYRVRQV